MNERDYAVRKATTPEDRKAILQVMAEVYQEEKAWIPNLDELFPLTDLQGNSCSWFLSSQGAEPVGAVRVLYDLPIGLYRSYQFHPVEPGFDLLGLVTNHPVAEVGRFAVLAQHRNRFLAAALLMKAAVDDTITRGFTHYITDVFENEATSPLQFHTRVLGFEAIATHDWGEFRCANRRITLMLDIPKAIRQLSRKGGWIYRFICGDWDEKKVDQYLGAASQSMAYQTA